MIRFIDSHFSPAEYNACATHPLQSWEWGEARKSMGIETLRIGEFDGDTLQRVFQMTLHRIPHTPYYLGYVPRSSAPSRAVLDFCFEYARERKIVFIKIEPDVLADMIADFVSRHPRLRPSRHPLFPDWSLTLDLRPSEAELLAHVHQKTRYNIRLAQRKGVYVTEESDDRGFAAFQQLYFETCQRQKYFGHDKKYHETVWRYLKEKTAHILIACYEGTPLAAYELFFFGKTLYYPYGGSSVIHREFKAPNVLMWEAIRLGKRLGAEQFDLWGSLPPGYDAAHPWAGFTRFKEGYGAKPLHFLGSFDLVAIPYLYRPLMLAQTVRQWYLRHRA